VIGKVILSNTAKNHKTKEGMTRTTTIVRIHKKNKIQILLFNNVFVYYGALVLVLLLLLLLLLLRKDPKTNPNIENDAKPKTVTTTRILHHRSVVVPTIHRLLLILRLKKNHDGKDDDIVVVVVNTERNIRVVRENDVRQKKVVVVVAVKRKSDHPNDNDIPLPPLLPPPIVVPVMTVLLPHQIVKIHEKEDASHQWTIQNSRHKILWDHPIYLLLLRLLLRQLQQHRTVVMMTVWVHNLLTWTMGKVLLPTQLP
jgi:hypothetical protein